MACSTYSFNVMPFMSATAPEGAKTNLEGQSLPPDCDRKEDRLKLG
jgi:hypothetical protein